MLKDSYLNAVKQFRIKYSDDLKQEVFYKDEISGIVYLDFANHFKAMMDFLANETSHEEYSLKDREVESQSVVDNYLDLTLKDILLNTEPVNSLKSVRHRVLKNTDDELNLAQELGAYPWDKLPHISEYKELGLMSWARYLNLSESSCHVRLGGALDNETRRFSDRTYLRIAQTLIFRSILKYFLDDFFLPFAFGDSYEGLSRLPRYFDGLINLTSGLDVETYLLRTSTIENTWVSAINNFGLAIEDVHHYFPEGLHGVLFVPGYPNPDTLKAELYWKNQKKIFITVFYLLDLYELVRIWDEENCLEYFMRRTHE
ncbi:MAG: hypothetical protein R3F48_00210 [Candidatus Zixiibacteriota bacterium]